MRASRSPPHAGVPTSKVQKSKSRRPTVRDGQRWRVCLQMPCCEMHAYLFLAMGALNLIDMLMSFFVRGLQAIAGTWVLKSVFVVVGWLWENNNENDPLQPFVLPSRTRINKSRTGPCVSTPSITITPKLPQGPGFAALILRSTLKSERATRYITTHHPPPTSPPVHHHAHRRVTIDSLCASQQSNPILNPIHPSMQH